MSDEPLPALYRTLLIAIYNYFEHSENANGQITEGQLRELRKYGANPGIARAGLQWLYDQDYLLKSTEGDQNETWSYWEFTHKGALAVDGLLSISERSDQANAIRLSSLDHDAVVDLSNNAASVEEVNANLEQIANYITTNNELEMESGDRAAVKVEIQNFQSAIKLQSVRTAVLVGAISNNGVLRFLKEKIPDKAVGALVSLVINSVAKWLGF